MSYLITQILVCLLLAFLLGFLLGWLLRHLKCKADTQHYESRIQSLLAARAEASAAAPAEPEPAHIPGYPVEEIQGIAEGFGRHLRDEGIRTTDKLLLALIDPDRRQTVCAACGIDDHTADSWSTMADLLRVPGVGGQWAELLWRCQVSSVQALSRQNPEQLLATMNEVNVDEHRVHELPGDHRVRHWIEEAARMPSILPD